jgi:hypothetical protein
MAQQLIQKNRYIDEFDFLYDRINAFTRKVAIDNKLFYIMVQRNIKGQSLLQGFMYHQDGLSSSKELFSTYKNQKELHDIAPYLASFSRLLAFIYKKASVRVGEEKADAILKESFETVKKKYPTQPDLQGYIPREAIGKAAAAAAAAFGTSVADNMLNFVADIYEKKVKVPEQTVRKPTEGSKEQLEEQVRDVFVEIIGPMGRKQFDKLERVNSPTIMKRINEWQRKGLLDDEKAQNFKSKIKDIFGG